MERSLQRGQDDVAGKAAKKKKGDPVEEGEDAPKKGGKRKLIIGVICVALAGGAYVVGSKSAATPAAGAESTTTTTIELFGGCKVEPKHGVPKTIIGLGDMSINLADGHYLRITVSLGFCADVVIAEGEEFHTAPALDIVNTTLSGLQMSVLAATEGREAAKETLTEALSEEYRGEVYVVYFDQFVMQ
jgi:flagellar FliL protein